MDQVRPVGVVAGKDSANPRRPDQHRNAGVEIGGQKDSSRTDTDAGDPANQPIAGDDRLSLGDADALTLESSGAKATFGEKGFSTLERLWSRPTCDINGLRAGYIGQGAKTVIGATATAKISCRLVANQKPEQIKNSLFAFLEERTPKGCHWDLKNFGVAPAIAVPTESQWLSAASNALTNIFPNPTVLIGTGGSIPVVGEFQEILGVDTVMVGFSLDDDLIHAPNEKFELSCFHRGILSHAAILEAYASIHA